MAALLLKTEKAYPNLQREANHQFCHELRAQMKGFDSLFVARFGRQKKFLVEYYKTEFGAQRLCINLGSLENPWNWENRDGEWPRLGGSGNREETSFWLDDLSYCV